MRKRMFEILVPALSAIVLIVGVVVYWHHKKLYPSTDDAYVEANIVNVAAEVTGRVNSVNVVENQFVKKGQVLFTIDPLPFQLAYDKANAALDHIKEQLEAQQMAVNSAKAHLQQAEAELINTAASHKRTIALVRKGYLSVASGDNSNKDLRVAQSNVLAARNQLQEARHQRGLVGKDNAELKSAETAVAQAKLNLSYAVVRAPKAGFIENISLRKGTTVSAFQPQFALVEEADWWVEANFKETQLERLKVGQPVKVVLDLYPRHQFHGKVVSLSSSSGSRFSLLPAQNASGNWVKVTQRFPVRIEISDAHQTAFPLRVGATSTVTVDTSGN